MGRKYYLYDANYGLFGFPGANGSQKSLKNLSPSSQPYPGRILLIALNMTKQPLVIKRPESGPKSESPHMQQGVNMFS